MKRNHLFLGGKYLNVFCTFCVLLAMKENVLQILCKPAPQSDKHMYVTTCQSWGRPSVRFSYNHLTKNKVVIVWKAAQIWMPKVLYNL